MISSGFRVVGVTVVSPAEQLMQLVSTAIAVRCSQESHLMGSLCYLYLL